MTKSLVRPDGSFEYICPVSGQHVQSHRPTVISPTDWLNSKIAAGKIKLVMGDLPEDASDASFEKAWKEASRNQAKALETLGWIKAEKKSEPEGDKKPEPIKLNAGEKK